MTTKDILRLIRKNGGANGLDLSGEDLSGIDLTGQNLSGIKLAQWDEGKGMYLSTDLSNSTLRAVNFADAFLQSVNFSHANLEDADLPRANLAGANFTGAVLVHADLSDANMGGVNLREANLELANLSQVDLRLVHSLDTVRFYRVRLDKTRLTRSQLGNAIGDEIAQEYAQAREAYSALKQNFEDLSDNNGASWAYLKERRMEKLESWQKKKYFKFLSDLIVEWLCDYGESVWRVLGWMAVVLFIIGPFIFSRLGGFIWSRDLADHYYELSSAGDRFWFSYRLYLLYTLDTFTTASFSDLKPINDAVKFASGFFAIIGIFLAGLLGFVAGNRIRRS